MRPMVWTVTFPAWASTARTGVPSTETSEPSTARVRLAPSRRVGMTVVPAGKSAERNSPLMTWYSRISPRSAVLFRREARVSVDSSAKASSVGAKTVKGPTPSRAPQSPATSRAVARVVRPRVGRAPQTSPPSTGGGSTTGSSAGGKRTWSMTWTTPFEATTSGIVTVASLIVTVAPSKEIVALSPLAIATVVLPTGMADDAMAASAITWYKRTSVNPSTSARRAARASASTKAKASSVGAKTVKGPGPASVSTRSAAARAVTSVLRKSVDTAMSTMVPRGVGAEVVVVALSDGGKRTRSMTWTTPFDAKMSGIVTVASLIVTVAPSKEIVASSPLTIVTVVLPTWIADDAMAVPLITWYKRTSVRPGTSAKRSVRASGSTSRNASSVGAKTVKGPGPASVSTRSAAVSAATSVLRKSVATAMSTMEGTAGAAVGAGVTPSWQTSTSHAHR
mmetsp:Transcript_23914/g.76925  ORF Transcript_23914/g.76925 Transcript_23914/m.76925 type:complete len:451 (+) Transcript_23914:264-1616(+)